MIGKKVESYTWALFLFCLSLGILFLKFGGLHFCPVEEQDDGTFRLDDLEQLLKRLDHTFPLSCVVCFECPHARKGGRVPSFEWIDQVSLFV